MTHKHLIAPISFLTILTMSGLSLAQPAATTTVAAEKKMRVGARVGLNAANVDFSPSFGIDTDARIGLAAEGFASIVMGPSFAIEPGLRFSQKGFSIGDDDFGDSVAKFDYVEAPVLAVGRFPVGPTSRVRAFGGGYLGFNINAKTEEDGESQDVSDDVTDIDVGVILGAGFELAVGDQVAIIDVRYELGLVNLVDDEDSDEISVKNRVASVNAGFAF